MERKNLKKKEEKPQSNRVIVKFIFYKWINKAELIK